MTVNWNQIGPPPSDRGRTPEPVKHRCAGCGALLEFHRADVERALREGDEWKVLCTVCDRLEPALSVWPQGVLS